MGGIFSTLGVVLSVAGEWAWLSFALAGVVALTAGYSYVRLASHYGEGGGAFTFLREIDAEGLAGSLSWVLIVGYILTNAVYAFTFGEYLAHVVNVGPWFARFATVAILGVFVVLNLRGAGEAAGVEIVLVWFKLIVLLGLAGWGLARWNPEMLSPEGAPAGLMGALLGAASVFMAYEGFQLLTYDYDDIESPQQTLPRAVLSAIVVVILVYVAVTLGTTMLVGADTIIRHQEVALALAGKEALGSFGLVLVTIAAAFSTGSAINSTLFATARLSLVVARGGELPAYLDHEGRRGIPDRAVIALGTLAAVLAVIGSLSVLVEAASLAFLFTFSVVCAVAFKERAGHRWLTGFGSAAAGLSAAALLVRLATTEPWALGFLSLLVLLAVFGRPWLLRHVRTESDR